MRVVVSSYDRDAAEWLESVLLPSGLSVVVLPEPDPASPELKQAQLLVADRRCAEALADAAPQKKLLLVPRGQTVDMASAIGGGFMDLVIVPSPEEDILARVGRALDQFLKPAPTGPGQHAQVAELTEVVDRVVEALSRAGGEQRAEAYRLAEGMLSVFSLLIDAHETSGRKTPGHSRKTGTIVEKIASGVGLGAEEASWLGLAGRLHDLGMVVLDLPLADAAPLSVELRRGLVRHPELSAEILGSLEGWGLPVDAIAKHHERPDGSGYPKGLEGEQVSLAAQILGAADVYEALTSPRPWRPAEPADEAVRAVAKMGFAAEIVEALRVVSGTDIAAPTGVKLPRKPKGNGR